MSTLDVTITIALPREYLPAHAPAFTDASGLPDEMSGAIATSCALVASSRNHWIHYSLRQAVEAFGPSPLAFLVVDPYSLPPPVDLAALPRWRDCWNYDAYLVSLLEGEALARGVRDVEAWLAMAESEPWRWAQVLPDGWDADEVRAEARRSIDLLEDRYGGGDGDHPLSLFSFLKGLRSLMLRARASEWPVAHLRWIELSGR